MSDSACPEPKPFTPQPTANPPGQSALQYRIGTHPLFKAAMKAALGRQLALQDLTTRADDDPAVALLDASAAVLDVLTFYQERIANEGYLRTAQERFSILALARAIGYELRPGVAASTYLAFELEAVPGAPGALTLDPGIRAQSIPGPGEKPQTFETIEKVEARLEWNLLRPQRSLPFRPTRTTDRVVLRGASLNLKAGDFLLVVGDERLTDINNEQWDFRRIRALESDVLRDETRVTFDEPLGWELPPHYVNPAGVNVHVFAFRTRAALFGHNAPDWRLLPDEVQKRFIPNISIGMYDNYRAVAKPQKVYTDWPNMPLPITSPEIDLDTLYPAIVPGSWGVLSSPDYDELCHVVEIKEQAKSDFGISAKVTHLKLELENFDQFKHTRRSAIFYGQSEDLPIAESPLSLIPAGAPSYGLTLQDGLLPPLEGGEIYLDRVIPAIPEGRALAFTGKRLRVRNLTSLKLAAANGSTKTMPAGGSLILLEVPLKLENGKIRLNLQDKAGFAGSVDITASQVLLLPALPEDALMSEVARVERCDLSADETRTHIELQKPLTRSYDRATLTIQANLAQATHGETRREVLGSGDASRAFQRFTLKQSPLTYLSADTPSGTQSTLTLRVNNLLWAEAPSLFDQAPDARVYAVRQDDDGKTLVQFGDGASGARPTSGAENITAVYRVGSGAAGNVSAGQISLLQTRPLGLKGVANPLAASGGDDPEPRDLARQNAPLTTLTLDRLVSLQDYEDFSRSFAGVAKAQAAWLWDGGRRTVCLTVAGANGIAITPESKTYDSLSKALQRYGLPYQSFLLLSYMPLTFGMQARVEVEPDRIPELVLQAVRDALAAEFGFAARAFAAGVSASRVTAAIQRVPGVKMADLNTLYLTGMDPTFTLPLPPLPAQPARRDSQGVIHPAQLLTLAENAVDLIQVI